MVATPIKLFSYSQDVRIDPVYYLKTYIERTRTLRRSEQLFVTHNAPHKAASVASIARWIAQVISFSGQTGTGGSVRSASSSYALAKGASLEAVLDAGDWSRVATPQKININLCLCLICNMF